MSEISKLDQNLVIKKIDNETVNLQITDDRGAKGYSQESIYTINPKVVLGSNEGDNLQTITIPINFQNISDDIIRQHDSVFLFL